MSDRDRQSDLDVAISSAPRTNAERCDARKAVFRDWFIDQAKAIAKLPPSTMTSGDGDDDRVLSVREIMARTESQVIIGSPREYQTQIFEVAKQQNTIAVLDTGSGKTLIAVLLLRYVSLSSVRPYQHHPNKDLDCRPRARGSIQRQSTANLLLPRR